ncbi:MAG: DegT/DnrJ/EryC1/StrS family aminotransferase [Anaerolineae bacterium]|nr:DegT/DnrJ/EryC1/StrS family aminotransferase [Anaerolineae bacterium]
MNIGIAKPFIGDEEKQAVMEVLNSGQLAQGPRVKAFEEQFAAYHHVKHGIAVNNGTTALIASLMAHDIGPGDEVIVPAFTFFATAASVLAVGAKPVFADIEADTFCLSPEAAEAVITPQTKAIMPVHLYGHLADMPRFQALCERHHLILLEDAAQAHGACIGDQYAGTWGTASFSFYPTKNMTTSEGGMILTNDDEIARQLRMIRNQGMNTQYYHEVLGYNFRMTDLSAAIGLVQLQRLPEWTDRRIENADFLSETLRTVTTPVTRPDHRHVFHQYTVRVTEGVDRDAAVKRLNERGIGARVYYPRPIHQQPVFQKLDGYADVTLPETDRATQQVFSLPVHPLLTDEEREYIVHEVNTLC